MKINARGIFGSGIRITAGIVLALLAAFSGMATDVRVLLFVFAAVMLFTGIFGF